MATVITPYTLVDGATLDPDQYNDNLYDPSVAGRGLLSEPDGGLEGANLAGGFLVQAEHILPGELYRTKLAFDLEPLDYYDDGTAVDNEASVTAPVNFVPVMGAACRIYVPYRSLVLWQWSVFLHPWRMIVNDIVAGTGQRSLEGFIVANIGGLNIAHTSRRLTYSALIENGVPAGGVAPGPGAGDPTFTFRLNTGTLAGATTRNEDRACLNYGQHHVEIVAQAGYREMNLRLFLEDSDSSSYVVNLRRFIQGNNTADFDHRLHTRASFGIRSAWAIGYHLPA